MESKTDQLNLLFDEWEHTVEEYSGKFVRDGIINEQYYQSATPKVLFITKEPNNPDQEPGDYREWWKEGLKYSFSNRIADWSYGLLYNFPQYNDIYAEKDSAHNAIKSIALMNIKKNGGMGISEYNAISKHIEINYDFLHRQIEIISPDIIITGLSWPGLLKMLFPDTKWEDSGYGISIGRYNNAKVIDYYHPSSRTAPAASYSLLQNIVFSEKFKSL